MAAAGRLGILAANRPQKRESLTRHSQITAIPSSVTIPWRTPNHLRRRQQNVST